MDDVSNVNLRDGKYCLMSVLKLGQSKDDMVLVHRGDNWYYSRNKLYTKDFSI